MIYAIMGHIYIVCILTMNHFFIISVLFDYFLSDPIVELVTLIMNLLHDFITIVLLNVIFLALHLVLGSISLHFLDK